MRYKGFVKERELSPCAHDIRLKKNSIYPSGVINLHKIKKYSHNYFAGEGNFAYIVFQMKKKVYRKRMLLETKLKLKKSWMNSKNGWRRIANVFSSNLQVWYVIEMAPSFSMKRRFFPGSGSRTTYKVDYTGENKHAIQLQWNKQSRMAGAVGLMWWIMV